MAKDVLDTRYLVFKPSPADARRAYWQPDAELREAGWLPLRLAKGLSGDALLQAAATEAHAQNQQLAAWQRGERPVVLENGPVKAKVQPGTLQALIDAYESEANEDYADLADSTRRGYGQNLRVLERWAGPEAIASLTKPRLKKFYKQLRKATPAKAKAVMVMAQILWSWGADQSPPLAPQFNPASRLKLKGAAPSGCIWPPEAVEAFAEVADKLGRPSIGTAVVLNAVVGQRQGDILKMPRNVLREAGLIVRQNKRGAGVPLPIAMVPWVKSRIEAELERTRDYNPAPTRLIVSEETKAAYKADDFRHQFAEIRRVLAEGDAALGIPARPRFVVDYVPAGVGEPDTEGNYTVKTTDLQFMHLRHTAVTRLGDKECDDTLISSITGHSRSSVAQILERYMVRTRKQAATAFARLVGPTKATDKKGEQA